jgi:hypothetical protein
MQDDLTGRFRAVAVGESIDPTHRSGKWFPSPFAGRYTDAGGYCNDNLSDLTHRQVYNGADAKMVTYHLQAEGTVRFYALRRPEADMIKSNSQTISTKVPTGASLMSSRRS